MSLKTYQWIKGDDAGKIVESNGDTVLEGNIEFLIFKDGSRCNSSLLGDFLMEIASRDEAMFDPNDLVPQPKPVHTPPPPQKKVEQKKEPVAVQKSSSPVETLLNSAKKEKKKFDLSIEIEIPPTDLLKVVSASFDNGEKLVMDYLTNGWSEVQEAEIKKQVADHIMNLVFPKQKQTKKNERV